MSLFKNPTRHLAIVESLALKAKGMTRKEIVAAAKLPDGGTLTRTLDELEQSGFLRRYLPFGKNKRDALYQLIDPYALFYLTFVRDSQAEGEGAWLAQSDSPRWQAWSGYTFEYRCRNHISSFNLDTKLKAPKSGLFSPDLGAFKIETPQIKGNFLSFGAFQNKSSKWKSKAEPRKRNFYKASTMSESPHS